MFSLDGVPEKNRVDKRHGGVFSGYISRQRMNGSEEGACRSAQGMWWGGGGQDGGRKETHVHGGTDGEKLKVGVSVGGRRGRRTQGVSNSRRGQNKT